MPLGLAWIRAQWDVVVPWGLEMGVSCLMGYDLRIIQYYDKI